jgi:glycosyltransferase involved in cell wall biosynthesis
MSMSVDTSIETPLTADDKASAAVPVRRSVAFYSPAWPPGAPNGIITYVANLRPALARLGVAGHVVAYGAPTSGPDAAAVNLDDVRHPFARRALLGALSHVPRVPVDAMAWGWKIARGLSRLVAERRLDLVEMEESFGAAFYAQQGLPVPVVVRLHGPRFLNGAALGLPEDDDFRRIDNAERRCIADAAGLTAPSLDVLERVRKRYGLPLLRAAVIPNPVPPVADDRRWRLDACDRKTILFVGRFDRHKGGDLVIDAFRHVAEAVPHAELAFVGPDRGVRDDAGRSFDLPRYLDEHLPPPARARVRVMGTLKARAIEELRRASLTTVVASRYENFPLALAEALAFGCPTVAADTGGIPEVLAGERTGLLFAAGDAADLAAKIRTMFENQERAAALGAAAAADVARRFAPEPVARATLDYYEAVWADNAWRNRTKLDPRRALYALTGVGSTPPI